MLVIKKDGRQQEFDAEKISVSAIGTAKDAGIRLSDREADLLASDVVRSLEALRGKTGLTSSYEIRMLLGLALKQFGYHKAAENYLLDALDV